MYIWSFSSEYHVNLPPVTVRLSLNFIVQCWGYILDREDRVS
jgi:hypothetical protein